MKRLLAVILVVTAFALSCGQASQNTGITTPLGLMFSAIPSEMASTNVLWFSNMARIKELAGLDPDTNAAEFLQFVREATDQTDARNRINVLDGYTPSEFSGGRYIEYWKDAFGFDGFDTSQEIMAQSLLQPNGTRSLFSVMKGNFAKNDILGKLNNLGYQLKSYASIDYYSIRADGQMAYMNSSRADLMAMANLNRIMVEEQEIIAAPADDVFFSVLDVRSGKQNSLQHSLAYTRIAGSLGDVLSAALIPQSQLRSQNVSADWDKLHAYDLAGIGYQVAGQDRKVVIALHYTDKSAADDIDGLSRRLAQYTVTSEGQKTPRLSDLFVIGDPAATVYGPDSILKVELVYKSDTPITLWSDLVVSQDLGFLVSNPAE